MLKQDANTLDVGSTPAETGTQVQVAASCAVAPTNAFHSPFSDLKGRFLREMGMYVLPAEATTGCTIISGNIKFGSEMQNDAGEFITINPLNYTEHQKVKLGVQNPTDDEKRLQINCYDGETVIFEDEVYGKADFLNLVRERGYPKARWETRAVLHGDYLTCERADKVKVAEDDRLFSIYLSPSSYKAFESFLVRTARGKSTAPYIRCSKQEVKANGVTWTKFVFDRVYHDVTE